MDQVVRKCIGCFNIEITKDNQGVREYPLNVWHRFCVEKGRNEPLAPLPCILQRQRQADHRFQWRSKHFVDICDNSWYLGRNQSYGGLRQLQFQYECLGAVKHYKKTLLNW